MKALELFAGGGSELGVEVEMFVEQGKRQARDDGAGQRDPLTLIRRRARALASRARQCEK